MPDEPIDLELMNAALRDFVPHNRALGITIVEASSTPAHVTAKLPWDPKLVGNPETQVLHGGVITTLLDAACGASVFVRLKEPSSIATLDLRVDFLSRAPAHRDVFARAECYHHTASVAFVRAIAWVEDPLEPFAAASATFALATRGKAITERDVREGSLP